MQKVDVSVSTTPKAHSPIAEDLHTERVRGTKNSFSDILHSLKRQQVDLEAAAHWASITEGDINALERGDTKSVSRELADVLDGFKSKNLDTSKLIPELKQLLSELDTEFTSYKEAIESRFDDLVDAFSTPHLGSVAAESSATQGLGQMKALISSAGHFTDLPGLLQSLISELRKFEEILEECRKQREDLAKGVGRLDEALVAGVKPAAVEGAVTGMEVLRAQTLPAGRDAVNHSPEEVDVGALQEVGAKEY